MTQEKKHKDNKKLRTDSKRLRDSMVWLVRGFTLYDPRKSYPGFYLSPQQSYVLQIVHEHGPITPGDVAKRLRLEKSHLTKIVNSLIGMKAVGKTTDSGDRRRLMLKLTEKGEQIFEELDRISVDSYQAVMEKIPPSERQKVIEAVEIMLRAVDELRKS
jgi:DNA-binding MarR family transcriptional regulator